MVPLSIVLTGYAGLHASFGSPVAVLGGDVTAVGLTRLFTTLPVLSTGVGFVPPASVVGVGKDKGS